MFFVFICIVSSPLRDVSLSAINHQESSLLGFSVLLELFSKILLEPVPLVSSRFFLLDTHNPVNQVGDVSSPLREYVISLKLQYSQNKRSGRWLKRVFRNRNHKCLDDCRQLKELISSSVGWV